MTQHSYEYLRTIKKKFSEEYLRNDVEPCIVSVGLSTGLRECLKVGLKDYKSVYLPLTFKGVYLEYYCVGDITYI